MFGHEEQLQKDLFLIDKVYSGLSSLIGENIF
jgi:hypothetical protein